MDTAFFAPFALNLRAMQQHNRRRWQWAVGVSAVAFGALLLGDWQQDAAQRKLRMQEAEVARQRVAKQQHDAALEAQQSLRQHFAARQAAGWHGPEHRAVWVSTLHTLHEQHALARLSYDVLPQTCLPVPTAEAVRTGSPAEGRGAASSVPSLRQTRLVLRFAFGDEAQGLAFLRAVLAKLPAAGLLEQCRWVFVPEAPVAEALDAECTLRFLTLSDQVCAVGQP